MCTRGSPDIYTFSPRACGPWASGVYIRQTTHAHGITIKHIYIYIYIEFRSLRILELSCTNYNENAGKPWIRQSFFRQCFKITISPKFFTAKVLFYTVVA